MPIAHVNGVDLFYEVTGDGFPMVFNAESGGDYRSWEPQVRFFARNYQVITYNYRGYPPSEVPKDPKMYSQEIMVEDLYQLLQYLHISKAHVLGLSMGGNCTLNFGFAHPEMCTSLVVAGCGAGSKNREAFERVTNEMANRIEKEGMEAVAEEYNAGPTRLRFQRKDPRGWKEFGDQFSKHSASLALIFRGVQLQRPSIFSLEDKLKQLQVPTLIMVGDEDEACIEPAIFMKRHISRSGLMIFPQSGHPINLDEPCLFNYVVSEFLTAVGAGKWAERGPMSAPGAELLPPK